jgi:phosphoglycolate phosphatase
MTLPVLEPTQIQILAFDMDGTIFSSENMISTTYKLAIERYIQSTGKTLKIPSIEEIMREVGKPVREIFQNLLPNLEEIERENISNQVLNILCEKIYLGEGEYYPKAYEVLSFLKSRGLKLVSASNGRRPYIEAVLKKLGVLGFFEPLVVLDYVKIKHKGEILTHYIKTYKVESKEIVIIGDRNSDYQAALYANCPFVFCEYGHAEFGEITSYSKKISCLEELPTVLGLL